MHHRVPLLVLCLASAPPLAADDAATRLDGITVSATKTPRPVRETAGVVTVIDAEEIDNRLVQDIRDLVRYEPGVSVSRDPARFGLGGFTIRGIGGNRVLIEVDGVPVADAFSIGSFSNAGRDFVDPEVLKRVEILRGAASSLYGSDALGGVVSFTTKDPLDYLADEDTYFAGKLGYNSDDASTVATLISAFGNERNSGMAVYTRRDGSQIDSQGDVESMDSTRTAPNPQDYSADNALLKGVFNRGDNVFRVTLDAHRGATQTDVYSARATQDFTAIYGIPYLVSTTDLDGDDERERTRVAFNWEFGAASWFDGGDIDVYAQGSETVQRTTEYRTNTVFGVDSHVRRDRVFEFEQDLLGLNLGLRKQIAGDDITHQFVYGIELERTETTQLRDGVETDLATGTTTTAILPDEFPVRDFPPSTTLEAGVYAQDEMRWQNGFTLIVGARADRFELDVDENDAIFNADNPATAPVDITETSVSPKLGFLQPLDELWTLFGQYAHGFRSPPYNDVNVGFTNLMFGYTAIPNPDLKPETSDGIELGVRRGSAQSAFEFTLFHNRYDDFIESLVSLGVDPATDLLTFQSQNVSEVTIEGAELRGEYHFAFLPGLRAIGAVSYARGENDETGERIASVDPHRAVLGLDYAAPSQEWGMEFIATLVDDKRVDDDTLFATPGYALFDVTGWVEISKNVKLVAGVFNLGDRTYWEWASVQGRAANDPAIDRYTQPGINGSIALRATF